MTGYWEIRDADGMKHRIRVVKAIQTDDKNGWQIGVTFTGFARLSSLSGPLTTTHGRPVTFYATD